MNYGLLFRALLICVPLAISGCGQDSGTDSGTSGEATGMPSNAAGVIVDVSDANAQFVPVLSYRTGAYAPNGAPVANGFTDYLKLILSLIHI